MRLITLFFTLWLLIQPALSQTNRQSPDTLKTYDLGDSIVVIASRYELSFRAVTNSVDVITEQRGLELSNHSALQAVDLMSANSFVLEKKVVGFGVGSNGSGNLSIRGLGGRPNTGIVVLINGRPDFMGIFGHPLPDVYGLEGIQQVEVIKGPSSTLFGSNAMGGAVNLVTATATDDRLKLNVGGGTYNTFYQNVQLSHIRNKLKINSYLSHQKTDGHIDSSGFEGWNMNGKIEYQISPRWQATLQGRYVPFQFDDPFMGTDLAQLGIYAKIRRGMIDALVEGGYGRLKNSFHFYSNLGHHRFNDGFESHDFTYGLSSYQNYTYSKKLFFSFGADVLHYGGKARNVVSSQIPPKPDLHTINTLGVYFIGFYSPYTFLSLQAGGRFHYSSLNENKTTPTLGISVIPFHNLKFFGNYNQGFRLPTLQELYLFPPSNPNLKFEQVTGYEAGIWYQFGENYFKTSYFLNDLKNLIQIVENPNPPPRQIYLNGEKAEQSGYEFTLYLTTGKTWSAQFSYSYLDPDILTAFNPEKMFKYYFAYHGSLFHLGVFGKMISKLYAANYSKSPLEDYHLVNISGSFYFKSLAFDIQLRNVLNKRYEVLPEYEAPRFHILTGITFNWFYSGI